MEFLKTEYKENYVIITLDRGKANPIHNEMITELRELTRQLEKDDKVGGAILTGKDGFFSAGLDVIQLYHYNKEQLKAFWINFSSMIRELAAFKKPLVAAITGHSPAGGCVLALCCDYRLMAEGPYKIGLNEIPVGITLPSVIFNLYAFTIGTRQAYQNLMEGRMLTSAEALEMRLIDKICAKESLLDEAELKLKLYLNFDPKTWQHSKQNLKGEFIASLHPEFDNAFKQTLEDWWLPETRARMGKLVESLKK